MKKNFTYTLPSGIKLEGTVDVDLIAGYAYVNLEGEGISLSYGRNEETDVRYCRINDTSFYGDNINDFFDACPGSFMEECAEAINAALSYGE